jgi:hypothetical protein
MTREKHTHTPQSARARVGQLFAAHGWSKQQRREWLNEHTQSSPEELFRAAEAALDVDRTVWRHLSETDQKNEER